MDGATRTFAWGASLLLVGCFSSPPAARESGGDTGSSASSETTVAGTSGVTPASATETAGGSTTSVAESSSSSVTGATTDRSTGILDSSSGGATSGETTGIVGCDEDRVEIDGMCLAPLIVTSAFSVVAGGESDPFDEAMPCLAASCGADVPLSGGFERESVALHSGVADFDDGSWGICGAPVVGETPNVWNASARCAVAEGDVFTVTEVFPLAGGAVVCLTVGCPEDTSLVGGGGEWGPDFSLTASQPSMDGELWEVCGRAFGNALEVEVRAYCAVLPAAASTQVLQVVEPVNVGLGCAEVACPNGIAIAGGGEGGALASSFDISRPTEDDESWLACGRAVLGSGEIRSRVLCYQL